MFVNRRSTVCKQACLLIARLAEHLKLRFQPQAVVLLPDLFKVLVISVQVWLTSLSLPSSYASFAFSTQQSWLQGVNIPLPALKGQNGQK